MDGGILDVPYKDSDAFLVEYLAVLQRKQKVYMVEQKTDVFKFFVDLDWRAREPIDDDTLLGIIERMCSAVPGKCLVARAPVRTEEDGMIKSGVHIHWPDTLVTRAEALAFRTRILLEMDDDPEWNDRIDSSVYGGSGLRMIGSHKMPTGDPYVPWIPGASDERITLEQLREFSIRCKSEEAQSSVTEVTNHAPLETYIRKYIPGQEHARVKRIGRKGTQSLWVQSDSKYCENVKAEHKSNHVWFSVYGDTICQRCHDEDCNGFVGREFILSPSIVEELTSNVAVDRSTIVSIRDLVPQHWFPQDAGEPVRTPCAPILGTGPRRVAKPKSKHTGVRGPAGRGSGRTSAGRGARQHS